MAEVVLVHLDTDGFPQEMNPAVDTATLAGLTMNGDIAMGSNKVTGLADGTNPNDAVNKGQLDAAVIAGGSWKELLLCADQLDDAEGILGALALYFANNPTSGDQVVISDGSTTRTYGLGAGGDVTVTIGGSAAVTMQNLVSAINGDGSAAFGAAFTADGLDEINAGGVVVVYEDATAAGNSPLRVYGNTWNTPADFQVVEYSDGTTPDLDYSNNTSATAANSDPGNGRAGLNKEQSELTDGDFHTTRKEDQIYGWDDSSDTWSVKTGVAAIPDATSGSGGAIKGKVTFDSDKGLSVTAGVAEVLLNPAGAVVFGGGGGIGVQVESTNPSLAIVSNELGVKFAASASALSKDATGLLVNVDGVTIQINGSNQLEVVGAGSSEKTVDENTFTTDGTGVTKGDPVFVSANGIVSACNANNNNTRRYMGVATATVGASSPVDVQFDGVLVDVTVAGGPSAGDIVYLAVGGGLTVTRPVASGDHSMVIGKIVDASGTPDVVIEPQYLGKAA
jgi:trimeric autotransporter adhesin